MRSTNSATSSSAKAFASDSIGTGGGSWRTSRRLWRRRDASGSRGSQLRKLRFQGLVTLAQAVVFGIETVGRVLFVVAPVVLGDFEPQRLCSARA